MCLSFNKEVMQCRLYNVESIQWVLIMLHCPEKSTHNLYNQIIWTNNIEQVLLFCIFVNITLKDFIYQNLLFDISVQGPQISVSGNIKFICCQDILFNSNLYRTWELENFNRTPASLAKTSICQYTYYPL